VTRRKPKPASGDRNSPERSSPERIVRPYALTAGRTRPTGEQVDVVSMISATRSAQERQDPDDELSFEHLRMLRFCGRPQSVADLATSMDLPLGVVRILIGDLRERGLVNISQPAPSGLSDMRVLKEVADALRRL
jgi:hypothetical protein